MGFTNSSKMLALMLAIFCLASLSLSAQQTSGEIVGVVNDPSGAVVSGATVTATNTATGLKLNAQSTASGAYRISNVPAGTYDIEITSPGFAAYSAKGVYVVLNKINTVNAQLKPGEVATTVEVTSAENQVDFATPQIQNTFEERQVRDNPIAASGLSGVINLSLLNAGVSSSGGVGVGTGPSVGGQRPRNNNFMIEGADNNDRAVTGPLAAVPNDAVANFTVLQNQVQPEFGYSSGGQFNTIVKSGTNAYHGMAYIYNQNRNYNARDFNVTKSQFTENTRLDDNRYGGNIGGPIIKDKLFGFFNFERHSIGQATVSNTLLSPTVEGFAMLNSMAGSLNATNLGVFQQFVPPATGAAAGTVTVNGAPIPIGELNLTGPKFQDTNTYVASGDWNISASDQMRARFIRNNIQDIDDAALIPAFWLPQPTITNLATLSEFHTFSPSVTNEIRLGYTRLEQVFSSGDFIFPGLDQFPNLQFADLNDLQVGPDPNAPQSTVQNGYQIVDNFAWQLAKHGIKFGAEFRWNISPQTFTQRVRGDYNYTTLDLYLRDVSPDQLGERSIGNPVYYGNMHQFFVYLNDQWKITPRLTLNLGARYEYTGIPLSENTQELNAAASVPGLIDFRKPEPQTTNVVPRIGLAWDPTGKGETSIRAGFGMTIDKLYDNLGILSLPPQLSATQDVDLNVPTPRFLANGGLPPGSGIFSFTDVAEQRAATSAFIRDQKLPYSVQWSLGVQQTFLRDYALEVRYVGTRGIHLPVQQRLNAQSPVTAANALPLFLTPPSQAELNSLTSNLDDLLTLSETPFVPAFAAAGFNGNFVTAFEPWGSSIYHGLQTQITRNFTSGFQFRGAYTWSHLIDNSTADVFSTVLNPRRPQDAQNFAAERSVSALDRRHRLSVSAIWDVPFFKTSDSWFMKNVIGNWEFAPNYTYETGQPFTVQSAQDVNLDGDSAGDRSWFFPNGVGSSDVIRLCQTPGLANCNSSDEDLAALADPFVVGYLAVNPNAKWIRGGLGQLVNGPRNTIVGEPINNFNFAGLKRFSVTERASIELHAQVFNILNHPQYVAGRINDVAPVLNGASISRAILTPGDPAFGQFNAQGGQFSANPRTMQLAFKVIF